jgi:hypothetical protein
VVLDYTHKNRKILVIKTIWIFFEPIFLKIYTFFKKTPIKRGYQVKKHKKRIENWEIENKLRLINFANSLNRIQL